MLERSRENLLGQKMGFNQMRNSIYWLQRFFKSKNLSNEEIEKRLLEMGKNIGTSAKITVKNFPTNLEDLIKYIYKEIVNSEIDVIINREANTILVKDSKCALCKYQYEDVSVPGCTIEVGIVQKILDELGYGFSVPSVLKSKSLGHEYCKHSFKFNENLGGKLNE